MHENYYTEALHWSTTGAGVKLRERDGSGSDKCGSGTYGNGNKIHGSGWEREEKSRERVGTGVNFHSRAGLYIKLMFLLCFTYKMSQICNGNCSPSST
jgi:hypothetical protein